MILWTSLTIMMFSLILFALTANKVAAEMSYVMEPFEEISDQWFSSRYNDQGKINVTMMEPGLFGERALRVEYQVTQSENWGGFVDFGWILNASESAHNCHGATHLSFWYNVVQAQSVEGRVHLRLIVMDDSDCTVGEDCHEDESYEMYYSFYYVLDNDESTGWQEVRVELRGDGNSDSPLWRTGWSGIVGNDLLDLDRLRGWRLEMSIDSQGGLGDQSEGAFLVDQLSCIGGGELLGAAFRVNDTFDNALAEGAWYAEYSSPLSEKRSEASLTDGMLELNYTIDKNGGLLEFQHLAPGSAYYNLSGATNVVLRYEIAQAASVVGKTQFRISLMNGSDCRKRCNVYPGKNLENYYAVYNILEISNTSDINGVIAVSLFGDDNSSSPFWRPGWTGQSGNNMLDASNLKGFRLEIYAEDSLSEKDADSLITGIAAFGDMIAVEDESSGHNSAQVVMMERGRVSYVMEPFENISDQWFSSCYNDQGKINLTMVEPGLFGERALQVEYQVTQSENWGGYVDFGWILNASEPAHNCHGATHLSFWYKIVRAQSLEGRVHLRLVVLDDSDCTVGVECYKDLSYETYVSFHYVLDNDESTGWQEVRVELRGDGNSDSPFWRPGWTGIVGNDELDLDNIRGWRFEMSIDSQGGLGNQSEGAFLVDQLSCIGGGELLGAAFQVNDTFADSMIEGAWFAQYPSSLSKNRSDVSLMDGMLHVNYTLGTGELLDLQHLAPGSAYYNLSLATNVSLDYEVVNAPSVAGNLFLRLVLLDASDCEIDCAVYPGDNLESYQTIQYSLDDDDEAKSNNISVALRDRDALSPNPLWQKSRTGKSGNHVLDFSMVKGYRLEFHVEVTGDDANSVVSGVIAIGNMTTVAQSTFFSLDDDLLQGMNNIAEERSCVNEPDLLFFELDLFRRVEFLGSKCCETCDADPNCFYALSTEEDCYMAPYVQPEAVGLLNTEFLQQTVTAFWMDDTTKRGDYCQVCECRESDRVIDCRGKDLPIVPKTFSPVSDEMFAAWKPKVLDLRGNPRLTVVGTDAFASIAETIEELRLPVNLRHLAFGSVRNLPVLSVIDFEGDHPTDEEGKSQHRLRNVITESSGFFGDVCCDRGAQIDLLSPKHGLTFCDVKVDKAGVDAHYEPFLEYFEPETLAVLRPSSDFMSEAAESPEKCAEYCTIRNDCMYFSYDARRNEAEHRCYLLQDKGRHADMICCDPDDYADNDQSIPGWTSGYPPRTRNEFDNARVISAPKELVMDETNGYKTQFALSLGSMPLRGAVWIEPRIVSTTNLNVSISPRRVALYDDKTFAIINLTVSNVDAISIGETLVVTNSIQACDAAYTAVGESITQETVYISVVMPSNKTAIIVAVTTMLATVFVVIIAVYIYLRRKRMQADLMWKINTSEVTFKVPSKVIGRGTFGPVLLGEYHGTQVAVKRISPPGATEKKPRKKQKNEHLKDNDFQSDEDSQSDDFSIDPFDDIENLFGMSCTDGISLSSSHVILPEKNARLSLKRNNFGYYRNNSARLQADFVAEMRYLSKLRHPCVTTVMGAIMNSKVGPKLVIEYMHHGSLYDLLRNETMDHREYILPMLCDITQGVRFLHATKPQVIHGDLKAQNILVDSRFRAKVTDFGLSQKKKHLALNGIKTYWMAPELLRGDSQDTTKSDVYAFGITLAEVYSCRDPFEGEEYEVVMSQLIDPLVDKRPVLPSSCPEFILSIMNSCLDNCPKKRPSFESLDVQLKATREQNVNSGEMQSTLQMQKEEKLLFEVFPRHIAEALRDGRKVEPESRDMVTIFFSDIVGFTDISSTLPPIKVSDMLDRLYHRFDLLSRFHDVFKVETIGDAYMAVTNLVKDQPDHTKRIADFAIDALKAANETLIDLEDPSKGHVSVRVGFHSGPVVANVVGSRNPRYCLFGDTVNTASRMESSSMVNRVHCSAISAKLLCKQDPKIGIRKRGTIDIKGKGKMSTFWINEGTTERRPTFIKQFSTTSLLSVTSNASFGEEIHTTASKSPLQPCRSYVSWGSMKNSRHGSLHGSMHGSKHKSTMDVMDAVMVNEAASIQVGHVTSLTSNEMKISFDQDEMASALLHERAENPNRRVAYPEAACVNMSDTTPTASAVLTDGRVSFVGSDRVVTSDMYFL